MHNRKGALLKSYSPETEIEFVYSLFFNRIYYGNLKRKRKVAVSEGERWHELMFCLA